MEYFISLSAPTNFYNHIEVFRVMYNFKYDLHVLQSIE